MPFRTMQFCAKQVDLHIAMTYLQGLSMRSFQMSSIPLGNVCITSLQLKNSLTAFVCASQLPIKGFYLYFQVYTNFRGGGGEAQLRREVARSVATNAAASAFTSRV